MMLYRPVNQAELDLIKALDWKGFPPRLPEQPIFYPVMNEAYAEKITREWNVPAYGIGHVVQFTVREDFIRQYEVQTVGLDWFTELWIPAADLAEMNANIVGRITLISTFSG